jgi:hypothetical protein
MNFESFFDTKQLVPWAKRIWSLAFWPLIALFIGLYIGASNSESRIISDCKYAMTFRVDHQAFACQRKI